MGKLGNFFKKAVGVVASVAAPLVKGIPLLGGIASSALSGISQKLLASPTPAKESAAALISGAPAGISTPMKESSIALQLGGKPILSTIMKSSAADLTGQSYGQSSLISLSASKQAAPAKSADDIAGTATKKDNNVLLYVLGGVAALLFFMFAIPSLVKKRR